MKERKLILELFRIAKGEGNECCKKDSSKNSCLNEPNKDKCKCE